MNSTIKTLIPSLFLVAICTGAIAADGKLSDRFSKMDRNKDGILTLEEFNHEIGETVKNIDKNRDKELTAAEAETYFTAIAPITDPKTPKRIAGVMRNDLNGDGRVTIEEMKAKGTSDFKTIDKNGDGVVTAADM
ncbi:hypothetical protein PQU92_02435 [Asticcacaulis sp. BYS171W]|uniref:EF-hand domain-containing protein n=1 Tax=Asticcacaulis aquaticus TaxID=2984212 RepID=A0ABT5HPX2_9CAUL|nr:hypothetical protein [Asticcacaulis aquaticus]MDC7682114.1 hypothetical protein [Asticcacaulis aquaticus]